ncbi:MAG: response regulator [Desulfobacter sp.]|nr:response regulator [Desulfobacter sp.]WDP87134.1 MAG: response regulator [Desulfobacter sp.]
MTDDTKSRQALIDEINALSAENKRLKQALSCSQPDLKSGQKAKSVQGKTILIVDDNEHTRTLVADMVMELGYDGVEAATPDDAISFFSSAQDKIDLIISDIVMPGGDGPAMVNKILKIKPDIKVIFMSGYAEDEIVHDAVYQIQDSCTAFIKKPFTLTDLEALIGEQINE